MRIVWLSLAIVVLAISLAACGGLGAEVTPTLETPTTLSPTTTPALPTATAVPSGVTVRGQAIVESIEVVMTEALPVQVSVVARGALSDSCTQIDSAVQQRTDNAYQIIVTTLRPGDRVCAQVATPFTQEIPLDVTGLKAGTYEVTVNGRTGSFTLAQDNPLPETTASSATPSATPSAAPSAAPSTTSEGTPAETPTATAVIQGLVWHDLCAVAGNEQTAPTGCVAGANNSFRANGLLDPDESGIEGVLINLGAGACPSTGLDTAPTDANGAYTFADLPAGDYCVSIDDLSAQNEVVLLPGAWTFPEVDSSSTTVTLTTGQTAEAVNFGWDFQFLPIPDVDPTTCTNSVEFVTDLSIPDDTVLAPGAEFVKEWRLRNNGTCPWTTEYKLVAIDEAPLAGDTEVAFAKAVVPGQTVDVAVSLVAPAEPGTYRANWQIADAAGTRFGINGFIEDAFYLRIVVEETVILETPAPNSAALGGVVWADYCLVSGNGNPSFGCLERGEGSGIYIANGVYDSFESPITALEITLGRGTCPADGTPIAASSVITTTLTDLNGLYLFSGLNAGTYCVSVDAFSTANINLLIPGDWTYPAPGVGRFTWVLDAGEEMLTIDFGWDFQVD